MMNRLLEFMKRTGGGKTTSKNLSRDDAREAIRALLDGAYHPVTFGSFLMALRFKGECPEELEGFLDGMAERLVSPLEGLSDLEHFLDCAGSYDGKVRTVHLSLAAALIAVAGGARILLHGSENVPSKCGMTMSHVLRHLGIETRRTPQWAAREVRERGISYLHQPDFHPDFHALLSHRHQVGKRTVLNTLEPLANPLGARAHLGGFFHDAYGPAACEAAAEAERGFERIVMVKGVEGSDELRPGAVHLVEWRNGRMDTVPTDTEALGLGAHISCLDGRSLGLDALAARSAALITALLQGEAEAGYRNLVLLNSAVRLYAAGCVESLEEGVERGRSALVSGAALQVLRSWQGCRHEQQALEFNSR